MNAAESEASPAAAFRALVSVLEHLAVPRTGIDTLLEAFQAAGFPFDRDATLRRIDLTGTLSTRRGRWRIDVILASTEFEQSAFQRAQRLRLYGVEANFPTPEDLILLKLVPGREKDLLDIKTVVTWHRGRLDVSHLERWAQRLSDEAEDARLWQTLRQLLQEGDATA